MKLAQAHHTFGQVEMREKGEQLFKLLRLKRLHEVREQERRLAVEKCQHYRDKIDTHKKAKQDVAREDKKKLLGQTHDDLVCSWQLSLVGNGNAQRSAKENWVETVTRINDRSTKAADKMACSLLRQKHALQQVESARLEKELVEVERARRISIRREQIASDREDAKAASEARRAREEAAEHQAQLAALHSADQPGVANQSVTGQDPKAPVVVQARIMKHGSTKADVAVISNKAHVEENAVVKRLFKRCIDELRNKNKALARARVARKSTTVVQNLEFLEAELGLLLAYDRSPQRLYRVKNASTVPPPHAEAPVVVQSFEKAFLSDHLEKENLSETISVDSYVETDDSEDDIPTEPLRKSREIALRASNSVMIAEAETSELKKREKVVPIRDRVLVKAAVSMKTATAQVPVNKEEPPAIVVSIPVPAGAGDGAHLASSSAWHYTPLWEKVTGVETGFGIEDNVISRLEASGAGDMPDSDESSRDFEPHRTTRISFDALQTSMQSIPGSVPSQADELNDSIESLGQDSSALQQKVDYEVMAETASEASPCSSRDDVEITRGSSVWSPMRNHVQISPLRQSLKEHSNFISPAELRVSISSHSFCEEVSSVISLFSPRAPWYNQN